MKFRPLLGCFASLALLAGWLARPSPVTQAAPHASSPAFASEALLPTAFGGPDNRTPAEEKEPLANRDYRSRVPTLPGAERQAGLLRLEKQVPDLSVEFDPVTGSAKWVGSTAGWLSQARGSGAANAQDAVRAFLNDHRDLIGHGSEVLDQAREVTNYTTREGGTRKIVWHQQLRGLDVFEAVLQANLTGDSALINIGSQFIADPEAALPEKVRAGSDPQPGVEPAQAIAVAGEQVGDKVTVRSIRPIGAPAVQADRRQSFRAAMLTDAEARLIWVPTNPSTLRLAWDVTLSSRARGELYRVLVDAQTATVLVRQSLTAYLSDASYRVFTSESPSPMSPGQESPSSLQPPLAPRTLVTTPALDVNASPNGWINDGGNITSGNNADAYTDTNADNIADLPRVQGSPARVFDFPLDLNQAPSTYRSAAVTQLFYWTNYAHDRLYRLGFTEAAGNFQANNFNRGGAGNDPVNAEAQDGSGTNNANFSTPADGGKGRMQMFLWTDPAPDRDGSLEAEIVLHEYCHGLSNRLVGGPTVTISALTTQGMGEGWSDFYSLALTAEPSDNVHGNWARAGYTRYQSGGWFSENYYFGTRRYSYSTDMLKNPHTFRDIDPKQVNWHAEIPRNPTFAATQDTTQVHYQGTVWCAMLWDLRANLVLKHGFETGNERAMFLTAEGMKFCPANPNFVQARDGIVQATLANHPEDLGEVWTAFAKRGLGYGAKAPASSTTTGVTESYLVPDGLELSDRSGWNITGTAGGAFTAETKSISLTNDGTTALTWAIDPHATWLSASPSSGTLSPGASAVVVISTMAGNMAAGFYSTNVVFTDTSTGFNQPVGVRLYVDPPVAAAFMLDEDPGWSRTGEWAFGVPKGGGGSTTSKPDPTSGATGSSVFGVNLSGNHSTAITGPHYLTVGPLDLSDLRKTRLRFMRWLNTNAVSKTRVTVEVSNDNATWREIFVNPGIPITDDSWRQMDYDISSIADRQSRVYVRWGYRTLSAPGAYSGWNIDDVRILGESSAKLALELPGVISESAAPLSGTLRLGSPQMSPVTVELASSDVSAARVAPSTVTFQPGETSKEITLTPTDDGDVDGTQITLITAAAPEIHGAEARVAVKDDETAALALTAPATLGEGSSLQAQLSISRAPTRDLSVAIISSHADLTAPASVVIPAGSLGPVSFLCNATDNHMVEGSRDVRLAAVVEGWAPAVASVTITDNDVPDLVIQGPAALREGDPLTPMSVSINLAASANLVVRLASSDIGEIRVPASVTIPAGQLSAAFSATVVNDTLVDGTQPVTLTAKATGYLDEARIVTVADNEVHHYTFVAIAPLQRIKRPFPIAITACDVEGAAIPNFVGAVTLKSTSANGTVPFVQTTKLSPFNQGVATGALTVAVNAVNMILTASDSHAKSGTSNAFNVEPGALDSFAWSGTPISAAPDSPFTAKLAALDDGGNLVAGYHEGTTLEAYVPIPDGAAGLYDAEGTTTKIYNTQAQDSRAQIIYTVAELGAEPRWIGGIQTTVIAPAGQVMRAFNIRMKHTDLDQFGEGGWESDGWTTVYASASVTTAASYFAFTRPFYYDGTHNLMFDISFNNTTASSAGAIRCGLAPVNRLLCGTSNSTNGDPLTWDATSGPGTVLSNEVPVFQLFTAASLGPIPSSPIVMSGGTWAGTAFAPASDFQAAWLLATSPSGIFAFSNRITLTAPANLVASTGAVFTENFESGALGAAWSLAANDATARTHITTASVPRGKYHLTMDSAISAPGTFARNAPTLTVNLAGRENVTLEWRAKGFNDEPDAPRLSGPFGSFDSSTSFDGVAVSPDGITWVEVSPLRGLPAAYPAAATKVFLDPIVQRMGWDYTENFQIRFAQYDDQSIGNDGIAIDDIAIKANPATNIHLSLPANIIEGTANLPVTVQLPAPRTSALTVKLLSNAPARLAVPASIVIPAGQISATANITAPQNQYLDIGRDVVITASATGFTAAAHHTRVVDDERAVATVSLPSAVMEGGTPTTGYVSITPMATTPVTIFLTSSDSARLGVSNAVTIPFGSNYAPFDVTPGNNVSAEGSQDVTVTASGPCLIDGCATMAVVDDEAPAEGDLTKSSENTALSSNP